MKASIVIATYNRNDLLIQTLQGLVNMDTDGLDWEVIIADNAGNEDTAQCVESFSRSLPIHYLVETQPGKNSALNTALKQVRGELVVFTDDDVIPDPGWLKALISAADRWPDADLFGGRIVPRYPEGQGAPDIEDKVFFRIAFVVADWDIPEGEHPAGKIWGPNMMVRRRVFDQGLRFNPKIGPTGSNYLMGSETEFLLRASEAGHSAVFVPSASVQHQIRPEQLTQKWICGRAYRVGRGLAYHTTKNRELKVEKWMLRELATLYARYLLSFVTGNKADRLQHAINYHKMRGQVYQCYKGRVKDSVSPN